jgi:hypothetical protein
LDSAFTRLASGTGPSAYESAGRLDNVVCVHFASLLVVAAPRTAMQRISQGTSRYEQIGQIN